MLVFSHSEACGKETNEDCILVNEHPAGPLTRLCFLADGQGGQSNGAAAARRACEAAYRLSSAQPPARLFEEAVLAGILAEVDNEVAATNGCTTLLALILQQGSFIGASVGDSRVYMKDARAGVRELTRFQKKNPPVGSGSAQFEIFLGEAAGSSRLLMVSDGVWKYAASEAIGGALGMPGFRDVVRFLRDHTLARFSGNLPDDFSIIAIETD